MTTPIATTTPHPSASATAEAPSAQHGAKAHSDGGWPGVPVQTRSARFASANVADFGPVTGREIVWKYTPVQRLADLIDGTLDGAPYDIDSPTVDGVTVDWIERTDPRVGSAGMPEERASANAWSSFEKALAVTITGEDEKQVVVSRSALGSSARGAHTVITAAPFSRALVILQNSGAAQLTENIEFVIGDSADITVVSLQEWADDAIHLASHFAVVGRDARLKHVVVTLGGDIVRVNPSVHLANEGADAELLGLYFADAGQHLEQQVYVDHDAPHTKSRVNYKGALQGEKARTVWIGDVLIRHSAPGTDSYEQNRNLVLSEGTRADSVPNLEIETGDILGAGHASATGRFDDEQLFYLQARGIPEQEARRLVVRGFLIEIVQKIGSDALQEHLASRIEDELPHRTGEHRTGEHRTGEHRTGGGAGMTAVRILPETELEPNQAVKITIDGVDIALVKDSAGVCHAIGDTCTHGDISLSEGFVEDDTLECWAHGSKFDLNSGKPLTLPAYEPVPVYPVTIVDGDIYIDPTPMSEDNHVST